MRKTVATQLTAHHNAQMAKQFPELYHPTTPEEAAASLRPIRGMLFAVDQRVRDKRSGRTGTVDYCTAHTNGSRKYVITWDDGGQRSWIWEIDAIAVEETVRPLGVVESGEKRVVLQSVGRCSEADGIESPAFSTIPQAATLSGGEAAPSGERATEPVEVNAASNPALPALRTPAAFFARQLDSMKTILSRYGVPLVRVPESVAGTPFPCYAEIDDGYLATKPPLLGGPLPVAYLVTDEKGVAIVTREREEGDDALDIRRKSQMEMYARLKRERTQGW